MNVLTPVNKRIIVEPGVQGKETTTAGGIVIPQKAKQNNQAPTKGTVISISKDSDLKLCMSPGDLVLFPKFAGTEIIIPSKVSGGTERILQIMEDKNILAVVRTDEEG